MSNRGLWLAPAIGLLVGVATQIGQSILPEGLGQLANSISPWLSVAFAVGALSARARSAAVAGLVALAFALIGYYAMVFLRFGYTGAGPTLVFWSIGALAGGVVFGAAGWHWRIGAEVRRSVAAALLGSAWLAEAGYLAVVLTFTEVALGYAVVGLAVPAILGGTRRGRLLAWAAMVPLVLLGAFGFVAFLTLYGFLTGVG